jgi:hypothetical protein
MLLKPIRTESCGMLRHKPFHPSLSAKSSMSNVVELFFCVQEKDSNPRSLSDKIIVIY